MRRTKTYRNKFLTTQRNSAIFRNNFFRSSLMLVSLSKHNLKPTTKTYLNWRVNSETMTSRSLTCKILCNEFFIYKMISCHSIWAYEMILKLIRLSFKSFRMKLWGRRTTSLIRVRELVILSFWGLGYRIWRTTKLRRIITLRSTYHSRCKIS